MHEPQEVGASRVPPHSLEAEYAVLGALMLDGSTALAPVVDVLGADDFYLPEHRLIFSAVLDVHASGALVDVITTYARLQELGHANKIGVQYLNKLVESVPSAAGAPHYANIVRERAQKRQGKAAGAMPDRAAAIKHASAMLAKVLKPRQAPAYPVKALGPLAAACEAIASRGQIPLAMVGQTLLGAAALLTQGLYNVETLAGQCPLSLFLLTLGDSGDGKSTAQSVALKPIHEWQRTQPAHYAEKLREAGSASPRKGDTPPEPPVCPYRLVSDVTVEGLRRDLSKGVCSQGVFNDEAVTIVAGYGMSAEQRAKTAGTLNKLWDTGHSSTSRARDGRMECYGRRLSMHWLIQPEAAAESISDDVLSSLGFWPRFLVAWPDPLPPRLARPFAPERLAAVGALWQRENELLDKSLPDDADNCPVLPLSEAAHELLAHDFERFEREGRCGALRAIKPFAIRASEQACRVAGVLTAFAGGREISADTMDDALSLVRYSLQTWLALIDEGAADQSADAARRLYEWLTTRAGWSESLPVIVNAGPRCVRSKDKRDAALALLQAADLIALADGRAVVTFDRA